MISISINSPLREAIKETNKESREDISKYLNIENHSFSNDSNIKEFDMK